MVRGGGACEVALAEELLGAAAGVAGRARLGVECLALALLAVPKTLARNAGFDPTDAVLELRQVWLVCWCFVFPFLFILFFLFFVCSSFPLFFSLFLVFCLFFLLRISSSHCSSR